METEELIKLVDGIYKNILDKFNPGARQMINAGKAYLKALHGAAAASRLYVDAISKLARQAQQGTWGGCSDIGVALMKVVEVYKEIHDQQMNILKAFYVDLLVPLETNLEKDTKVVQSEQKRFLQLHKQRSETYSKAAATIKKQRKKTKGTSKGGLAMDRELKNMQVLEEEKTKLDSFCEQSLKNAMTQERRRYGFVLERHCSLTKHYISYHNQGVTAYQKNLDKWSEVAKTREFLPETVENIFSTKIRQVSIWQDDDLYSDPRSSRFDDDRISLSSQLRKTKSMDASCLDVRSIQDISSPVTTLSRAKSEFNVNTSTVSLVQDSHTPTHARPKSMAVPPVPPPQWETQLARTLYAYLSSGDNQLSFLEGDIIALIGERNKGWQFGENLRTQCTGWFPLAYTEIIDDSNLFSSPKSTGANHHSSLSSTPSAGTLTPLSPSGSSANATLENPSPRMFGDTLHLHRSSANAKQIRRAIASNNIPPPALPAPIPTPSLPYHKTGITQSQSTNFNNSKPEMDMSTFQTPAGIRTSTSTFSFAKPSTLNPLPIHLQTKGGKIGGPVGNVSLHSSNDSGFSNDPPPQPEIDYSDDESLHAQTKAAASRQNRTHNSNTLTRPSVVSSNLGFSDDQSLILREERKGFVKRTKSFWKFGKSTSDGEILEGMALWKHRDLVDVAKERNKRKTERTRKPSSDSERTLNAIQFESSAQPETETNTKPVVEDEFYDREDGLLMRTVNRKEILQQYDGDTTGSESDNEVIRSEDPYDCIVVKDQTQKVRKNAEHSNVAAIGKKLEKLSKSSKFSPEKEQNNVEIKNEKNRINDGDNTNIIKYTDRNERHYSFKTFKNEQQSNDNNKKESHDNKTRSSRRFYNEDNRSHIRSSYESINSETTTKQSNYDERIRDNSADDEYSDAVENRQFLPRTKLTKTNSNGSAKVHENGGNNYNGSVKKKQERNARSSRNTYGPWYDLWGLDASVGK